MSSRFIKLLREEDKDDDEDNIDDCPTYSDFMDKDKVEGNVEVGIKLDLDLLEGELDVCLETIDDRFSLVKKLIGNPRPKFIVTTFSWKPSVFSSNFLHSPVKLQIPRLFRYQSESFEFRQFNSRPINN